MGRCESPLYNGLIYWIEPEKSLISIIEGKAHTYCPKRLTKILTAPSLRVKTWYDLTDMDQIKILLHPTVGP